MPLQQNGFAGKVVDQLHLRCGGGRKILRDDLSSEVEIQQTSGFGVNGMKNLKNFVGGTGLQFDFGGGKMLHLVDWVSENENLLSGSGIDKMKCLLGQLDSGDRMLVPEVLMLDSDGQSVGVGLDDGTMLLPVGGKLWSQNPADLNGTEMAQNQFGFVDET